MRFSAAGFIARMPLSMTGIGIVTMFSELRGSFAFGSIVTGIVLASQVVFGPWISRKADRFGQRKVALPATAVSLLGLSALLLFAKFDAPDWTLLLSAVFVGTMPSVGAMVRARWTAIYRGDRRMHTAFSFESVVDELCFITGPVLAVALSTSVFPEAGPMLSGIFLLVGVLLLTAQTGTEPAPNPGGGQGGGSAMKVPGLRVIVACFVFLGVIFGAVEVATVAFAEEVGQKSHSGYVLSAYALGSCLAGVGFGVLKLKQPLRTQFLVGLVIMPLTLLPLLFIGGTNLVLLGALLFVAGFTIAPTLITASALTERMVPAHQLTEGLTWTSTGLAAGVSAGSAVAGPIIDGHGAAAGFVVLVVAAFAAVTAAALGFRWITTPSVPAMVTASGNTDAMLPGAAPAVAAERPEQATF
jgi:MFS family permease